VATCLFVKTGPKPKSKAERQKELDAKYGKREYLLLAYSHTTKPATVRHKCGQEFEVKRAESLFRGLARCSCQHTKQSYRTLDSYNQEIATKRPGFECIEFNGIGNTQNTYKRLKCGHTYQQSFNSFNLSKHCPVCAGPFGSKLNRFSEADFKQRLHDRFGKAYKLTGKYINTKVATTFKHKCGHTFTITPGDLLRRHYDYCEVCNNSKTIAKYKIVTVDGFIFKMQGHEPFVLPKLVRQYGAKNIVCNHPRKLRFRYTYNKIRSSYYPDFYVPSEKLVVEVKSLATLGLLPDKLHPFGTNLFRRMKAKAKQVKKQGYKFRLYLMEGNRRIKLPTKWYAMSKQQVLAYIKTNSQAINVLKQSADYWRDNHAAGE